MKRRNFVKTLASLAAVGALPSVAAAAGHSVVGANDARTQGPGAGTPRTFGGSHFSLEIGGTDVGAVASVEGGNAVSEVVLDAGTGGFTGKHLGALSYEPLKVVLNAPPHPDVTKLINESLAKTVRTGIAIVGYDFNYKVISYRELTNAYLAEVGLSKLDAASAKEPLGIELTFQPELVRTADKSGGAGKVAAKSKAAGGFRFSVSGLDAATQGVSAVDMPSAKLRPLTKGVANSGKYDLSAFTVELSMQHAKPYLDWFEQFAIKRSNTEEATAKLELMTPDLKSVLYTVTLEGVGISALRTAKQEAGNESIAKLEATLYAERMTFGS